MSIELGVWRISPPSLIQPMDNERRLEDYLEKNIDIIAPQRMVIGRQVPTSFSKYADFLTIDVAGNLAVIERNRDQAPRDVVAKTLDYGSWGRSLGTDQIARIWQQYLDRYRPSEKGRFGNT